MNPFREINTQPTPKDLRAFALVMLIGCGALAGVQLMVGHELAAKVLAIAGTGLAGLSFVPSLGRLLYIAWMGLGAAMGIVTSPIVLGVIYLVVFVPAGIVLRALGRDALRRKLYPGVASYWEPYANREDPRSYFRQF